MRLLGNLPNIFMAAQACIARWESAETKAGHAIIGVAEFLRRNIFQMQCTRMMMLA
jgi:hypothetical protein